MNDDMSEFQQRAAAAALMKMLSGKYFSICDLDAVARTMGKEQQLAGRDYAALRSLHCIDWMDMGPDLARMTRAKCIELLGLSHEILDVATDSPKEKPAEKQRSLLRLAFRAWTS